MFFLGDDCVRVACFYRITIFFLNYKQASAKLGPLGVLEVLRQQFDGLDGK